MLRTALSLAILGVCGGVWLLYLFNAFPQRAYTGEELGLPSLQSPVDFNRNGRDDYADLLLGARRDAAQKPAYDGRYWESGYPPDDIGVCTDVIWRAFREAGYSLRGMVDRDIAARPEAYLEITEPDSNIDFRRVKNLRVFFDRYAVALTTDPKQSDEWQPGDIVIFRNNHHIGIVSDLRNRNGRPYIIHNGGFPQLYREEDYLRRAGVTAHYRFDASLLSPDELIAWE